MDFVNPLDYQPVAKSVSKWCQDKSKFLLYNIEAIGLWN